MIITLLPNAAETHNVDRLCASASKRGAAAVGLRLGNADVVHPDTPRDACLAVRRAVAAASQRISAAWLPVDPHVHFGTGDATAFTRSVERTAAALQRAAWLGAETLVIVPAVVGAHEETGGGPACSYADALNGTHSALQALRFATERCGVSVSLLAGVHRFLLSPVEVRELIDEQHSSWIGACVDLMDGAAAGWPSDWIRTLGRRVFCFSIGLLEETDLPSWPDTQPLREARASLGFSGPVLVRGSVVIGGFGPSADGLTSGPFASSDGMIGPF